MKTSPTTAAAIELFLSGEQVSKDEIDRRLRPAQRIGPESAVLQTVQAIQLSRPRLVHSTRESACLTAVQVESEGGIAGVVYVQETADGRLEGLRLTTPVPRIRDAEELRMALSAVAGTVSVLSRDGGIVARSGPNVIAGSSLMKLFILDATLAAVESRALSLATECVIRQSDISYLSSGLTAAHVGKSISVGDLCSLLTLRSDNTAADLFLRILGSEKILATAEFHGVPRTLNTPLLSTREYFLRAWGRGMESVAEHSVVDSHLRERALKCIRYTDGLDYFITLESIDNVMRRLSERSWTPWHVENHPEGAPIMQFKGGSAPGVLAGSWLIVGPDSARGLTFCLNGDRPFGAIEEVYAFSCAEALLSKEAVLTGDAVLVTGEALHDDETEGIGC
ncbi:serine hydrolase [Rathayibacter iranicus]|uniref:Beta-lactamase class A catalytic domain-containing protein n=2 Tax=Rathayibacter iranicus TaxID=59737 RepID=A0AAD2PTS1_9MICO|nr:serine hydrolase [Rathayibacter iranicus]AZZ54664.1 hypothetical protein C7V51_01255 [Rathayibacter iranicus]MWV30450.1 hypothetical protein [Rathayibacter iranicus NCPPB 2253 = VKM Ac-1602]PPI51103.1 hypothetical protein C5E09_01305 [Rathayibacter iranicus]PPI63443.1 hypothetical protein C5E08_01300 [Rathayibacter iranicus]PPI74153.1 hypothetical protein C5E01_01280 [Rathayibacter iranicus]